MICKFCLRRNTPAQLQNWLFALYRIIVNRLCFCDIGMLRILMVRKLRASHCYVWLDWDCDEITPGREFSKNVASVPESRSFFWRQKEKRQSNRISIGISWGTPVDRLHCGHACQRGLSVMAKSRNLCKRTQRGLDFKLSLLFFCFSSNDTTEKMEGSGWMDRPDTASTRSYWPSNGKKRGGIARSESREAKANAWHRTNIYNIHSGNLCFYIVRGMPVRILIVGFKIQSSVRTTTVIL